MINIPTDLLRTLVTVVDLRSFTKAAHCLGVTQPAVSAQIKRLHALIGHEILDRSAPGVSLTPLGEMIVEQARRILSINDHIVGLTTPRPRAETIRIGVPGDFISLHLPYTLAQFRLMWPGVRFHVRSGHYESLLRDLREGEVDLFVGLSTTPSRDARYQWAEPMTWVRSVRPLFGTRERVPLVSYGEHCTMHRVAVDALNKADRPYDIAYVSSSTKSLAAAISAGLGTMVLARHRVAATELTIWDDAPLPLPADIYCGVYIGEGGDRVALEQLAEAITGALNPAAMAAVDEPVETLVEPA